MTGFYASSFDSIAIEAGRRGVSVTQLGARNILVLSAFGRTARYFGTITDRTSHLAVLLSNDKRATKELLSAHGLQTPSWYAVDLEDQAVNALHALNSAVVVKPHNGNKGRGVGLGLTSENEVREAFRAATKFSRIVLVERYHVGRDYRITVVDGRAVAAMERRPPAVVGDGMLSIADLITGLNNDPRRGNGDEKPMTKIVLDRPMEGYLRQSGRTSQTIPAQSETVVLSPIGSLSQGSISIDCTGELHVEIADLAVKASVLIGLDIAGIDVIARDISLPLLEADAQIIEINCSPGLRGHLFPAVGRARDLSVAILDYLFPESSKDSSFP